jgi:hypothetical protein
LNGINETVADKRASSCESSSPTRRIDGRVHLDARAYFAKAFAAIQGAAIKSSVK